MNDQVQEQPPLSSCKPHECDQLLSFAASMEGAPVAPQKVIFDLDSSLTLHPCHETNAFPPPNGHLSTVSSCGASGNLLNGTTSGDTYVIAAGGRVEVPSSWSGVVHPSPLYQHPPFMMEASPYPCPPTNSHQTPPHQLTNPTDYTNSSECVSFRSLLNPGMDGGSAGIGEIFGDVGYTPGYSQVGAPHPFYEGFTASLYGYGPISGPSADMMMFPPGMYPPTGEMSTPSCPSMYPLNGYHYSELSQPSYPPGMLQDPAATSGQTPHSVLSSIPPAPTLTNPQSVSYSHPNNSTMPTNFLFSFPSPPTAPTNAVNSPSEYHNMNFGNETEGMGGEVSGHLGGNGGTGGGGTGSGSTKCYFWQYNSLSKGPKSENHTGGSCGSFSSPHELVQWRDPIHVVTSSSPASSTTSTAPQGSNEDGTNPPRSVSSALSVKMRRGLSSEISPNFAQMRLKADNLVKLNEQSANLTKQISLLQSELTNFTTEKENRTKFRQQVVANQHHHTLGTPPLMPPTMPYLMLPINDTILQEKIDSLERKIEELRGQKNQLASRTCRSRRSAFHEANKIKFAALAVEHGELMKVLEQLRSLLDYARCHGSRPPLPHASFSEAASQLLSENRFHFAAERLDEYVHEMYSLFTSGEMNHPALKRLLEDGEFGGGSGRHHLHKSGINVFPSPGSGVLQEERLSQHHQEESSVNFPLLMASGGEESRGGDEITFGAPPGCPGTFYMESMQTPGNFYQQHFYDASGQPLVQELQHLRHNPFSTPSLLQLGGDSNTDYIPSPQFPQHHKRVKREHNNSHFMPIISTSGDLPAVSSIANNITSGGGRSTLLDELKSSPISSSPSTHPPQHRSTICIGEEQLNSANLPQCATLHNEADNDNFHLL